MSDQNNKEQYKNEINHNDSVQFENENVNNSSRQFENENVNHNSRQFENENVNHNSRQFENENVNHSSVQFENENMNQKVTEKRRNSHEYSFWAEQISESSGNVNFILSDTTPEEQRDASTTTEHRNEDIFMNVEENISESPKKPSKLKKVIGLCFGAVFFGLLAGGTFLGVNQLYYHFNPDARPILSDNSLLLGNKNTQLTTTTTLDEAVVPNTDVTEVFQKTIPSVVAIKSKFNSAYHWFGQTIEQEEEGSGSGIIVGLTDKELLVVTNNHVVDGAIEILVTFIDGSEAQAIVKGTDSTSDLAVMSIDVSTLKKYTLDNIKVATLGDSEQVKEGEMAIAIGNALGYGQSITVGYVSAKDRQVEFDHGTMNLLQIDTAINPGNSGGALLNTKGEVIGINCGKLAASQIEGICYAIPISAATPIINELMNREIIKEEEQGYLGVYIEDSTIEANQLYNIPVGVQIMEYTTEDSPAKQAGLLKNDIIVAINGVEIATKTSLKEKVNSYRYGTEVTVTIMRLVEGEYKEMDIKVTLGKNPSLVDNETNNKLDPNQDQNQGSGELDHNEINPNGNN